jgi:hypothetical protein
MSTLDVDFAGREFDKWLDWNGTAGISNNNYDDRPAHSPISPPSTTDGDIQLSHSRTDFLTAPSDLLTPRHSSPESRSSLDMRLSGDTLRDDSSPSERLTLKRKLSPTDVPTTKQRGEPDMPAAKKRPHNIIEKRYRANLNEKIAELRDSVPSLRFAQKTKVRDTAESDEDDLDGLAPSNKLNKASILTKAVEYIRHLEFRTKRLEEENKSLKDRLETLDKVIAEGGNDAQRASAFTSDVIIEESTPSGTEATNTEPADELIKPAQGLIGLPDSWKRLRQSQSQDHYGHIYQTSAERSRFKGKWPTRIVLGSIAGLMIMDGLSESDTGTESRAKGLFGIPLELLDGWQFLRSPRLYLVVFSQYCQAGGIVPLIKGFVALTFLAFLIFSYLFNSKPVPKADVEKHGPCPHSESAPASPLAVRRRAWSTSMQALRLPHHYFFSEWFSITSEWLKYTFGYLLGPRCYAWLTGRVSEEETARIKAWDIAVDAQLAGGDAEVSRSRILLTIFGAGNLPKTPLRLMMKAMHCRVLLWNVGTLGSRVSSLANRLGKYFAHRQWIHARQTHESLPLHHSDRLPKHLESLLDLPCEDVFQDTVCQRAYNLMYDRPTQESSHCSLLDVVVEDHAVRSPLDAVAAWRSSLSLKQALELYRQTHDVAGIQEHLATALKVAPCGSAAETRALAATAVLGLSGRRAFLFHAEKLMGDSTTKLSTSSPEVKPPFLIDSSTPQSARREILDCLHIARTIHIFADEHDLPRAKAFFWTRSVSYNGHQPLTGAALQYLYCCSPSFGMAVEAGNEEVRIPQDHTSFVADESGAFSSKSKQTRRLSTISNDSGYDSADYSLSSWDVDLELAACK